jgi:hypothetical protein
LFVKGAQSAFMISDQLLLIASSFGMHVIDVSTGVSIGESRDHYGLISLVEFGSSQYQQTCDGTLAMITRQPIIAVQSGARVQFYRVRTELTLNEELLIPVYTHSDSKSISWGATGASAITAFRIASRLEDGQSFLICAHENLKALTVWSVVSGQLKNSFNLRVGKISMDITSY